MTNINFLYGYPVEFKHLCMVYPPKVCDTFKKNFFLYAQILTLSQEEIEDEYVEKELDISNLLNPFEYLLNTAYNDTALRQHIKDAFFLFIHEDITFLYEQKQIVIGDISKVESIDGLRILKEEDYFDFQNLVRESLGRKAIDQLEFKTTGMEFATEMIAVACRAGIRIGEIPVSLKRCNYDRKPKLRTIRDGFRHLFFILSIHSEKSN